MKAMALIEFDKELQEIELPDPVPGENDVILDVAACGVCQTDLKIVAGTHPSSRQIKLPHVPGHEIAGVVSAVGRNVKGWNLGDRAIVYLTAGCGTCKFCRKGRDQLCLGFRDGSASSFGFTRNGGFGEKVKVPVRNLVRYSDKISDEAASIIPDALATAVHAVMNRGTVCPGERVLIFGAGGVGLHTLQAAHLCGAYTIIADIDEDKLKLARQYGADQTVLVGKDDFSRLKVDKIFETSGVLSKNMWLMDALEIGGTLIIVGYRPDAVLQAGITEIVAREYEIKGSRGCTYTDLVTSVELVERGLITPLVGTKYSFRQVNQALADLKAGKISGRGVLSRET